MLNASKTPTDVYEVMTRLGKLLIIVGINLAYPLVMTVVY